MEDLESPRPDEQGCAHAVDAAAAALSTALLHESTEETPDGSEPQESDEEASEIAAMLAELFESEETSAALRPEALPKLHSMLTATEDDGDSAFMGLQLCLGVIHEDRSHAEQMLAAGLPQAIVTAILRHGDQDCVLGPATIFLSLMNKRLPFGQLEAALLETGPENAVAALAMSVCRHGYQRRAMPLLLDLMLVARSPDVALAIAKNRELLEAALRIVSTPPLEQCSCCGSNTAHHPGGSEAENSGLALFAQLHSFLDPSIADAVAALPGYAPAILTALREAHAQGRKEDVGTAIAAIFIGYYAGNYKIAKMATESGDDAALRLMLRFASDPDITTARSAAAMCDKMLECYDPPHTSPLARCPVIIPSLIAALRQTGGADQPREKRDEAALFPLHSLMLLINADQAPRGKVEQLAPGCASDIIARLTQLMEGDLPWDAMKPITQLLSLLISGCVNASRLGPLTSLPLALSAAARVMRGRRPGAHRDGTTAQAGVVLLASVSRIVQHMNQKQEFAAPWTAAQLLELQKAGQGIVSVMEKLTLSLEDRLTLQGARSALQSLCSLARQTGAAATAPAQQQERQQQLQQPQQQQREEEQPTAETAAAASTSPAAAAAASEQHNTCGGCGASAGPGGSKLLRCKGCRQVRYCSQACATAAWRTHKRACRAAQAAEAAAAVAGVAVS